MFKPLTKLRAACALAFALALIAACAAFNAASLPAYAAGAGSGYAVMELTTGTTLSESNYAARLPMASTTKIMTALLVCEDCDLDKVVTVPQEAVGVEGSSIYLKKDEQIDVRDLLYGLMLRSGNDSAVALAIIHSGSVQAFVECMNARAKQLGADDTHFCNPNGLHDESHYTTARDLCKIACAAMKNSIFRQVVGTKSWQGRFRSYSNKNKMLYNFEGATGVKTGYTTKAGRCLVSSAERDGMELVCVVLNEYDMYGRSSKLLNDCFARYQTYKLPREKVFMCKGVPCRTEKDFTFVAERGGEINYSCIPCEETQEGAPFGQLKIYRENNLIFSANLYSII